MKAACLFPAVSFFQHSEVQDYGTFVMICFKVALTEVCSVAQKQKNMWHKIDTYFKEISHFVILSM